MVVPMEASGAFPPMVISMVQVGEERCAAGHAHEDCRHLRRGSRHGRRGDDVDHRTHTDIFLALIVGTIVIAMFLPLVDIINQIGGSK